MAFRTRRHERYEKLRKAGFLPFEARPLSRVPIKTVPYMGKLIAERRKELVKAERQGKTRTAYENLIRAKYRENKWLKAGKRRIESDPWRMLRDFEDQWRAKQPEYSSPWQKRQRKLRDFIQKYERTIDKEVGSAPASH